MKYPRTFHLNFSPGGTDDDKRLKNNLSFINQNIVITSKIDGSNVCLTSKECFARTHSGPPSHPSFDLFKQMHADMKVNIPDEFEIFGEFALAKHSIHYSSLPSYLFIFGILNTKTEYWLSWKDVNEYCSLLNLTTVPQLFEGTISSEKEFIFKINSLVKEKEFGIDEREGIVVRLIESFHNDFFKDSCAKWVRKNHVSPDNDHWKHQKIIKNELIK